MTGKHIWQRISQREKRTVKTDTQRISEREHGTDTFENLHGYGEAHRAAEDINRKAGTVVKSSYRMLYEQGRDRLQQAGIADAKTDAWYLLSECFSISRMTYLMERETLTEFPAEQTDRYEELIARRALHIPLQHLTGEQEFMGYPFLVNEHVLIPRQDTETLVETVLELTAGKADLSLLDMCTGSGCIAISLALQGQGRFTHVKGVDLSVEALAVAKENGRRLDVEIEWVQSDMFTRVLPVKVDVLVSNPPYIRPEVVETLMPEVRDHEPRMALDGGLDGLDFYRILAEHASQVLNPGGYLAVEIGHDQGAEVSELFTKAGLADVFVKKDMAGLERVVAGRKIN